MKHRKRGRKFGRERDQRRALMKSLASSFFMLGRVKTTEAKAKELKRFAEPFVTRAQNPSSASIRYLRSFFSEGTVRKLLEQAKGLEGRAGGYTRVIKIGVRRRDAARMAIIELVKT